MAYGLRWTVSFDSRTGKACRVMISDSGYTGNVTALTGAAVPFQTQEDDDEDIFTPVRGQTGYIRIVSDDINLIDTICPANNLQHLVELEVDGTVLWRGYQQAEVYEQEWRSGVREIELPIRSVLASLDTTELGGDKRHGKHSLGSLLYDVFSCFGIDLTFRCIWNFVFATEFFLVEIYSALLFSDSAEDGEYQNDKKYSSSGDEVIKEICKLYGLVIREANGDIYIISVNDGNAGGTKALSLSSLKSGSIPSYIIMDMTASPSLNDFVREWRGDDNKESRIKTFKSVSITLGIEKQDSSNELLYFPDIEEDGRADYDLHVEEGTLHVQPYVPTMADEMYGDNNPWVRGALFSYRNPAISFPVRSGDAFATAVANNAPWRSLWSGSDIAGTDDTSKSMYAGAFPCRWSFDTGTAEKSDISTTEGYYLSLIPIASYDIGSVTPTPVFHINTEYEKNFSGGYIGIDFNLLSLMEGYFQVTARKPITAYRSYWIGYGSNPKIDAVTTVGIYMSLKIGDNYWNGSGWQTGSVSFPVNVKQGKVVGNYDTTMGIDNTSGLLIPLGSITSGVVEVQIMDFVLLTLHDASVPVGRSHFMSNFTIKYHRPSSATSMLSDRSENNYYARTGARGYAGAKHTDILIGTYNNNRPSDSFLILYESYREYEYYISSTIYRVGEEEGRVDGFFSKRIEEHLLNRMKDYYSQPRRVYEITVNPSAILREERVRGLAEIYPQINDRTYMAVDADHDWREDTQRIKLIECKV